MSTVEQLRRLTDQSRVRLAAAEALREDNRLIARQSQRRLEAGRRLLDQCASRTQV